MSNTVILAENPSQAKAYTENFAKVEKIDSLSGPEIHESYAKRFTNIENHFYAD